MNLDFLTPEIFDMLVITNLIVASILIVFRFYQDVRYSNSKQHREQAHDESSYEHLADTELHDSDINHLNDDTKQQSTQHQ